MQAMIPPKTQSLFPRIILSIAGQDGHAPLQNYTNFYKISNMHEIFGLQALEYRGEGFANCVIIIAAGQCSLPNDNETGVLSFAFVPCDISGEFAGVNSIFENMVNGLQSINVIRKWWKDLSEFENDVANNDSHALVAANCWSDSCKELIYDVLPDYENNIPAVTHFGKRILPNLT